MKKILLVAVLLLLCCCLLVGCAATDNQAGDEQTTNLVDDATNDNAANTGNQAVLIAVKPTIIVVKMSDEGALFSYLEYAGSLYYVDGALMLPLQMISDSFGYQIRRGDKNNITIIYKDNELELTIDNNSAIINGQQQPITHSPLISADEILVPFDVFTLLGLDVEKSQIQAADGGPRYLWVSEVPLLNTDDVAIDDNYQYVEEGEYYQLREGCMNNRGFKVGDSLEQLIASYGPPHKQSSGDYGSSYLYFEPSLPDTSSGSGITIEAKDGLVTKIKIAFGK